LTRKEKILINIQPESQVGLEFGPLTSPIITSNIGSVRYVDHASTEELKAKCELWGTIDISKIVEVDFVWKNENLKELTAIEVPYDYVIASHVVEHVPDFIGWFKEIRSVLKTGGIVSLAIPDKRFTFDYLRQVTRPADVLEAYLCNSKRPSAGQVFDYKSQFVNRNSKFKFGIKEELIYEHTLEEAWEITQNSILKNHYEDVHCWVFTELSFLDLLISLVKLNLFDFKIAKFFNTTGIEFIVSLEAMDLALNKNDRMKIQIESIEKTQKKLKGIFNFPLLVYGSWMILNIIRNLRKKISS
jgi:predicted SAM-dependent methyltransferase